MAKGAGKGETAKWLSIFFLIRLLLGKYKEAADKNVRICTNFFSSNRKRAQHLFILYYPFFKSVG